MIDFKADCPCEFDKKKYIDVFNKVGYFKHEVACIDLKSDYLSLIGGHKGQFKRDAHKCERLGFKVKQFHRQSYITDVVDINFSKEKRSGGLMKTDYRKSVEEWGGQPNERKEPVEQKCKVHGGYLFGCFANEPGYWQDEKLVAYLGINVLGNFVNYSTILGHANYFRFGIMAYLHLKVLEFISTLEYPQYVVYYLWNSKEQGLMDWKRRAGFVPAKLRL